MGPYSQPAPYLTTLGRETSSLQPQPDLWTPSQMESWLHKLLLIPGRVAVGLGTCPTGLGGSAETTWCGEPPLRPGAQAVPSIPIGHRALVSAVPEMPSPQDDRARDQDLGGAGASHSPLHPPWRLLLPP